MQGQLLSGGCHRCRQPARPLDGEGAERTGPRVERQDQAADRSGAGDLLWSEARVPGEVFHEHRTALAKAPPDRRLLHEASTARGGRYHAGVRRVANDKPYALRPEHSPDLLRGQAEALLEGDVPAQAALKIEDCLEPRRAGARLIDQPAHDPAEGQRGDDRDQAIDALRGKALSLQRRQREGCLEEPGDQPDQTATAGAHCQSRPHGGHEIRMPECGWRIRPLDRDRHGDGGKQEDGAYDRSRTRVHPALTLLYSPPSLPATLAPVGSPSPRLRLQLALY